jgi:hypothetical protein
VTRRCALGARLFLAVLVWIVAAPGTAGAQSASPSPERGPSVSGQVTGALSTGSALTIGIDATIPGGWEALHLVEASIVSGGQELERLRFDIEDNKLTVGEQDLVVGTGAVASGEYLRVSGTDVVVTTGGANLSFEAEAGVVKAIPEDARFELSVTDDVGTRVTAARGLARNDPDSGLTWGAVLTAVVVALFAGGFLGNRVASRRRPPARLSVYGTVQRRIDEERKPTRDAR